MEKADFRFYNLWFIPVKLPSRHLSTCLCIFGWQNWGDICFALNLLSVSRLNVIFSKFDEVQRSGNMVLSPMSGKITFPVISVFVFLLLKLGLVWVWFSWQHGLLLVGHVTLKSAHYLHSFSHFRFQNSSSAQVCCSDLSVHKSYIGELQHWFMLFWGCFFGFFKNWCWIMCCRMCGRIFL